MSKTEFEQTNGCLGVPTEARQAQGFWKRSPKDIATANAKLAASSTYTLS